MADQTISEEQKQALVRIYLSFRREHEDERAERDARRCQPRSKGRPRRPDRAGGDRLSTADRGDFAGPR